MADEIKPALSPEEWASVREEAREPADLPREEGPLTGVTISYTHGRLPTGALANPFAPAALIALLNAALPDGDPRKLTREDVATLRAMMGALDVEHAWPGPGAARHAPLLLAKLAALLPPEPARG